MSEGRSNWRIAVGARIHSARKARGLSQEEVANRLGEGHGRSKQLISHWENGRNEITSYDLYRLAHILGVDVDFLAAGRGSGAEQGANSRGPEYVTVPYATRNDLIEIAHENLEPAGTLRTRAVSTAGTNGIAFDVFDRAMEPKFPLGATCIVVSRETPPEPGDCCLVVLLASNEVLFRRIRPSIESQPATPPYVLRADNPDFEARQITDAQRPVVLGRMVEHCIVGSR